MKKLFLSIILSLAVLPFFALELQHDVFVGESDGLDTAILFGQNKIKNGVGLYFDTHWTKIKDYDHHSSGSSYSGSGYSGSSGYSGGSSSGYSGGSSSSYDSETISTEALTFGLYYQFSWGTNFFNIGNVGFGLELPVQLGIGFDSVYSVNIFGGICPSFKFEFNKFDLFLGYKLNALLAEITCGQPFIKSSVTIGVRYNLKKGAAVKSSGSSSSSGKTTPIEAPSSSSDSKVNVIPGSDIKTIRN